MSKRLYKRTPGEWVFDIINCIVMVVVVAATLYPFWYICVGSISSISHLMQGGFVFWPDGINLESFRYVLANPRVPRAYMNTIFVTVVGTSLSMVLTIMGAYVLSKKYLPGHGAMTMFVVITMLFGGGLIPTYLVINSLGLIDTIWVLILPSAISTYNMVVMRNFLMGIPQSLEESAQIDGARHLTILTKIYLPLSMPSIATITLFYAVSYWNAFFNAVIYLNSQTYQPLQILLREVVLQSRTEFAMMDGFQERPASETVKMALVIITVAPILVVYPFLQKYFVKGVLVGSLKG